MPARGPATALGWAWTPLPPVSKVRGIASGELAMTTLRLAVLEQLRFGDSLRERGRITDEQWLAARADHWSSPTRRTIGATIVAHGYLPADLTITRRRPR